MSLMSFLFAVEAVREEEGVRFHVETPQSVPSPVENRERNAQSMQMLQGILGGSGTMKPRRQL